MALFRHRRNRDDEPADPEERSPQLGIKFKDLAVMGELMKAGADLVVPREVNYYCYAPSKSGADSMAIEASTEGFGVVVREPVPDYPGRWTLICTKHAALTPDFVRRTTDYFDGLAARHTADYDGWDAAIAPSS